jgi:hypothetical protein
MILLLNIIMIMPASHRQNGLRQRRKTCSEIINFKTGYLKATNRSNFAFRCSFLRLVTKSPVKSGLKNSFILVFTFYVISLSNIKNLITDNLICQKDKINNFNAQRILELI